MITEKEKIISNENYEISMKIYNLFKKYRNYTKENINSKAVNNQTPKYNYDDLFKKNRIEIQQPEAKDNVESFSLVEYKESIFTKILNKIKSIFRRN